ncbi:HNH endonuclease signature motif containing protein [Methanococcoides burtonii]|uniref:HNH endonuclease signature motif containing protein n=1 Tax=Methanococcoides burtonii TaxID=29291 RepID=UPI0012F66030
MRRELVEYKGITFARYPTSKSISRSRYFYPFIKEKNGTKIQALHQEIWKDANGEIPDGYDIHHRDGNPSNN